MKREYHNKFKYKVVMFYDITLDTDVLIGIFLVGITALLHNSFRIYLANANIVILCVQLA